jgi:hypothetical protein
MHSGGPKRDQEIAPAVGGPDQRTPSYRVVDPVCAPATDRTGRDVRYPRRQLGIALLRLAIAVITAIRFWPAPPAWSATSNYSIVPSAAIGRDIPAADSGGGEAGDAVGNWVTAGDAMNTLAGKDISLVTPTPEMVMLFPGLEHQA